MSALRTKPDTSSEDSAALAAFVQKKARIDDLLAKLAALSDDHFNVTPDEVHWGHVGNLDCWLEGLERIARFEKLLPDE